MIADERRRVEEALIRWREEVEGEWRTVYYFDCGELGVVGLSVCMDLGTRYWQCRWLDIEPLPPSVAAPGARRAQGGEWYRSSGLAAEYKTRPLEVEDLPFGEDITEAFEDYESTD